MRHKAIRNLYPAAALIDDGTGVFDSDKNQIVIDEGLVAAEVTRLEKAYAAEMVELKEIEDDNAVIKGDPGIKVLVTARPAQIETWINNSVTDLATTKTVLIILAKAVSYFAKRAFR